MSIYCEYFLSTQNYFLLKAQFFKDKSSKKKKEIKIKEIKKSFKVINPKIII